MPCPERDTRNDFQYVMCSILAHTERSFHFFETNDIRVTVKNDGLNHQESYSYDECVHLFCEYKEGITEDDRGNW